jgi:gluconate 5-dehydrogenase
VQNSHSAYPGAAMTPFDVNGKVALITGATRGIGFGAAKALAQSGANILLLGRDTDELQRRAAELRAFEREIVTLSFDLMHTGEIRPFLDNVFAKHGSPDILVNSAGIQRRGEAVDISLGDFNEVLTLNTTALFEVSRTFARHRIAHGGGGKVINLASLMTAAARPNTSPYAASKGAVGQLTKVLAIEWAKYGIYVNAVAPGYIDTDLNMALTSDPDFDHWVKIRCTLGRWGTPEDIAWPIVFLASAASDFVTGQVIYVDGGWLATF